MKFLWTTIHVNDLNASVEFYTTKVGLELRRRFTAGPETEMAFLGVGETEIELIHVSHEKLSGNIEGISIGFDCEDVETHRNQLSKAGIIVTEMISPNPSLKFFYAKDPDGVNVQFVQDMRR